MDGRTDDGQGDERSTLKTLIQYRTLSYDRQTLTSPSDSVLFLLGIQRHAQFPSDTKRCPMVKSGYLLPQQLIGSDTVIRQCLQKTCLTDRRDRKNDSKWWILLSNLSPLILHGIWKTCYFLSAPAWPAPRHTRSLCSRSSTEESSLCGRGVTIHDAVSCIRSRFFAANKTRFLKSILKQLSKPISSDLCTNLLYLLDVVCVCVYGALIQLYWCLFLVLSMDFYVCTMWCESCRRHVFEYCCNCSVFCC